MCALSHLLEPLCLLFWANSLLGKLQPWSQGVIAAVVFLVLVAIVFVVNRFWLWAETEHTFAVGWLLWGAGQPHAQEEDAQRCSQGAVHTRGRAHTHAHTLLHQGWGGGTAPCLSAWVASDCG
uniref:Uncharacterized protein n=1 Tax=Anas platyrhynchos TaxID=8839 RepID=A0A8B9TU79_ANAPL